MELTTKKLQYYWKFQEKCNQVKDYDEYFHVKATGDHLCVFYTPGETIIAVDATDTDNGHNEEWKSNFDHSPAIKGFHKGFYLTAKSFFTQMVDKIEDSGDYDNIVPVTFIGHSRGGGIAPILDFMFRNMGFTESKTVTFAAPRCTTLMGSKKLKKAGCEIHRVEACRDIVDNVPPFFTPFPPTIWRHYATHNYDLPTVDGIDHKYIGKALKELANG